MKPLIQKIPPRQTLKQKTLLITPNKMTKKIIIVLAVFLLALFGYFWSGKKMSLKSAPLGKSSSFQIANKTLDQYEQIIKSYENRGGIKSKQEILNFSLEIQNNIFPYNTSELKPEELTFLEKRLKELRVRQTKLLTSFKENI